MFLLIEQRFRYIFYTGKYKKASMKGSFTHMVEVRGVEPLSKSSPTYKRLQLIPWLRIPQVVHGQTPVEVVRSDFREDRLEPSLLLTFHYG